MHMLLHWNSDLLRSYCKGCIVVWLACGTSSATTSYNCPLTMLVLTCDYIGKQMHVAGLGSGHPGGSATSSGRGRPSQQLHSHAQLACQFVG